jgi:hypothetical protein
MGATARIDPDAFTVLEKYRQMLKDKGRPGASFSDAVREMDRLIKEGATCRKR